MPPHKELVSAIEAVLALQSPRTAREIVSLLAASGFRSTRAVSTSAFMPRDLRSGTPSMLRRCGHWRRRLSRPQLRRLSRHYLFRERLFGCLRSHSTRGSSGPWTAGRMAAIAGSSRRSPAPARPDSRSRRSHRRSLAVAKPSRSCQRRTCRANGTARSCGISSGRQAFKRKSVCSAMGTRPRWRAVTSSSRPFRAPASGT